MSSQPWQFVFEAIGTHWVVDIYAVPPELANPTSKKLVAQTINDRIELFDKTYSRFRADSVVTQMAKTAGVYTLPDDAQELFSVYHRLYELTNGAFTPLIA